MLTVHDGVPVTAKNVDFFNCDRELVQFPATIQGHGAMLVVDEPDYVIRQASANCAALIGKGPEDLCGHTIADVFGVGTPALLAQLRSMSLEHGPVHVVRESFAGRARGVNLFAHRCGGVLILELEGIDEHVDQPTNLYSDVRASIAMLQATSGLQPFLDLAVLRIRKFTGYDRVMAYEFDEDGSGHVVAEAKADALEPYLGLHYPATDIPAPARRLFGLSWLRHLPAVDYAPVPLVPETHPETGEAVDMSYAILRSVSVMYTDYLRNMGVQSTMVMPLMKDGKLWGLISAMHHSGPRHVPYEARMAAEFMAHMLSLLLAARDDADTYAQRMRMKGIADQLVEEMCREPDLHRSLADASSPLNLMTLVPCHGAALVAGGQVSRMGDCPGEAAIRELVPWLAKANQPTFATDRLSEHFASAVAYRQVAAGVLATRIGAHSQDFMLWFRPEHIEIVNWAGDPKKPMKVSETDGQIRLSPRSSFALWKESVTGRCEAWDKSERDTVSEFRQSIMEVILSRAEELERVNRRLAEANVELDSFAYAASHDLKEPLRAIHHMTTFLKRGQGQRLDEEGRQQVETILKLTRRMDDLIESLLQYSRTGRVELSVRPVNVDGLVDEALLALKNLLSQSEIEISRPMRLGTAECDGVRVREVFTNLISNAAKYNDKIERRIEIGVEQAAPPRYYVRDNGIGIAEQSMDHIFDIFGRVHAPDAFGGGVGAGLTIARKTIERHGGRIWLTSCVGEGSTFYFTLAPEASA